MGKKGFSFIEGEKSHAVGIFEGFLDFLSCVTDLTTFRDNDPLTEVLLSSDKTSLGMDILILNSAFFKEVALDFVITKDYSEALVAKNQA